MCMTLDVPATLESHVADYEQAVGKPIQRVLLEYLQREFERVRLGKARVRRFHEILAKQPKLMGEPYVFHRQDAYDEELA